MKERFSIDKNALLNEWNSSSSIKSKDLLRLKGKVDKPFMMSSIYTEIDFDLEPIYKRHNEEKNLVTIICVNKTMEIPYEVLELGNQGNITFMQSNPRFTFTISTGSYIINPKFLDFVFEDKDISIEDIIKYCLKKGQKIGVFIIPSSSFKDIRKIPLFID